MASAGSAAAVYVRVCKVISLFNVIHRTVLHDTSSSDYLQDATASIMYVWLFTYWNIYSYSRINFLNYLLVVYGKLVKWYPSIISLFLNDMMLIVGNSKATSKLLINYPEHLRSEILDYLFKVRMSVDCFFPIISFFSLKKG